MKIATVTIASKEYEKIYQVHLAHLKIYLPNCDHIRYFPNEFESGYKNTIQHICASRPEAILRTFEKGYDLVIFLGADVVFYKYPELLFNPEFDVIITPHLTAPIPNDGMFPSNESIAKTGHLNSDLVVWKYTPSVVNFLRWQRDIMIDKCIESSNIFLDQTWLNFLPFFIRDVHIERHPAYNMAYWNFKQREHVEPVCFQFSGFDPDNPKAISRHQNRYKAEGKFLEFLEDYARRIK